MIVGLIEKKPMKAILILLICLFAVFALFFVAIPLENQQAHAASLHLVVLNEQVSFYKFESGSYVNNWSVPNFNPFEDVIVNDTQGGSGDVILDYSFQLINKLDSQIVYSANCNNGVVTYVGGNYPKYAGEYFITATSANGTGTADVTLRGYAQVNNNPMYSFSVVYDGYNYFDLNSPTINAQVNYDPQQVLINNCFSIAGATNGQGGLNPNKTYTIDYDWSSYVNDSSEVINAMNYDCYIYLRENGAKTSFFDFSQNGSGGDVKQFVIEKRPLLIQDVKKDTNGNYISGSIDVEKEKSYNGNSIAGAKLYTNGSSSNKYDYLLSETKSSSQHSGILQLDLASIRNNLDGYPLFRYTNISNEFDSYFFTMENGVEIPSSSISTFDSLGNIIYDKGIRMYCALNPVFSTIVANYLLTTDTTNVPSTFVTFTTSGAITPKEIRVHVDSHQCEYGTVLSALMFSLINNGTPPSSTIGVSYTGNLLDGDVLRVINSGSAPMGGINIGIKYGREYRADYDSPSDIVFRGTTEYGTEIALVDYYNDIPSVMDLYYYPIVYYNTQIVSQTQSRQVYVCGNLDVGFISNIISIKRRQLLSPSNLIINSTKEYDGLLQASYSGFDENSFNNQWVGDDYRYITAKIKPIYNDTMAGANKVITVSYVLSLTQLGIDEGKGDLLNRYLVPPQMVRSGIIEKKVIEYSFDMTKAVPRPNEQPYTNILLFPENNILTFEKGHGAELPQIKDFVFGTYATDGNGNIIYENIYRQVPQLMENAFGDMVPATDFYGNIIYVDDPNSLITVPRIINGFLDFERPDLYPNDNIMLGRYNELVDWSFYGIPIIENGILKRIVVSSYDPITKEVTIIDANTQGAIKYTQIDELTPATGEPGIKIGLSPTEYSLNNYILVPSASNRTAYMKINKKTPIWSVPSLQEHTYNAQQNSNMLDHILLTEPILSNFENVEQYEIAYNNYLYLKSTYKEIIKVDLSKHDDRLEIIGSGGQGININVFEYALPGEDLFLPLSAFSNNQYEITKEDICLIKYAGKYRIKLSLPETSTCIASEEIEIMLEIKRQKLNVYLSNSERFYNEPNPDLSGANITQKIDIYDNSSWGWLKFNDTYDYRNYMNTIFYDGFVSGEGPNNLPFGDFSHCDIIYEAEIESQPGDYNIYAQNGYAFNYRIEEIFIGNLLIKKIRAEIILETNEVTVTFDYGIDAWRVHEIVEGGQNGPTYIYRYTANDGTSENVRVKVIGFVPLNEAFENYDFSIHYKYLLDDNQSYVLDNQGNKIVDAFYPKVIFIDGQWLEYKESLANQGEVRDCTPTNNSESARFVGQYLFEITAQPDWFEPPYPQYVKFIVDYADTIVEVSEEVIESPFNPNTYFKITDDEFYINNHEINIEIKLEKSDSSFEQPLYELIHDYKLFNRKAEPNTQIMEAGYYKLTIRLEYPQDIQPNYHIPEVTEYILYVHIIKRQIFFEFDITQGMEEWTYTGLPFGLIDKELLNSILSGNEEEWSNTGLDHSLIDMIGSTLTIIDFGVPYSSSPYISIQNITLEIYRLTLNSNGEIIDSVLVTSAINAGFYRFKAKANSNIANYADSDWIEQVFEIKKANVEVLVEGKEIALEDIDLFPNNAKYPLHKIYGDTIIENRYNLVFNGWVNGENINELSSEKWPLGFNLELVEIDWNGADNWNADAGNYDIRARSASSTNYHFTYKMSIFVIKQRKAEVLTNEDYLHSTYTGTDHRRESFFRANVPPESIDTEVMDFAFALNHDPNGVDFYITIVGKLVYNEQTQQYERKSVQECIDVGIYIFKISATASRNYTAVEEQEYEYEIVQAELRAIIAYEDIVYEMEYGKDNFIGYPMVTLSYEGFVGKDFSKLENSPENNPFYQSDGINWQVQNGMLVLIDLNWSLKKGLNILENLVHPYLVIPINAKNVGEYEISLNGGETLNYYINVDDVAILTIYPKRIEVRPSGSYVEKRYDAKSSADDALNEVHYYFDGVLGEDVVILSFSAEFDRAEVGDREVLVQELYIDNENYELITTEFTCWNARILPATPIITLSNKHDYIYDGNQKEIIPIITGIENEVVNYILTYAGEGYNESESSPTNAGSYTVKVTINDENYEKIVQSATMIIQKAWVDIVFGGDIMQEYGSVVGLSAYAYGLLGYETDISNSIIFINANNEEVVNIKSADIGEYAARAFYAGSRNYNSGINEIAKFTITPKAVEYSFIETTVYEYDGKMKHQVATFYNVKGYEENTLIKYARISGDGELQFINVDINGEIIPSIAPKDVGQYIAYAYPQKNYELISNQLESCQFEIIPKDITIKVNDLVIKKGELPVYTFEIIGLANGESINNLDIKPFVGYFGEQNTLIQDNPINVGRYTIMPYGAMSINYNISYSSGKLDINTVELSANTLYANGMLLFGSFSPNSNLNVKLIQSTAYNSANLGFEVFKMENAQYKSLVLSDVYEISIDGSINTSESITVKMLLSPKDRNRSSYQVVHILPNGKVKEIIEAELTTDGYLEFTVSELGTFGLMKEELPSSPQYLIYLAIAGAVLLLLVAVIIIKKRA